MTKDSIDKVIHQPVRTKIMAYLANVKVCDYTTLKNTLGLTDGHMTTHMRELLEHKYVEMEKSFVDNKPKTTYHITKLGLKNFKEYVSYLKSILG